MTAEELTTQTGGPREETEVTLTVEFHFAGKHTLGDAVTAAEFRLTQVLQAAQVTSARARREIL